MSDYPEDYNPTIEEILEIGEGQLTDK